MCTPSYSLCPSKRACNLLFMKAKLLPLEFQYYKKIANSMYEINITSAPINISNLFSKITSVHSYGTLKNLQLMFKVRPLHVLALKSGMGNQLVSKTHPRTLLKNPLE